jgi:hypothetical protein
MLRPLCLTIVLMALVPDPGLAQARKGVDTWFPVLREGMWVKVEGEMQAGALHADEIRIYAGELDEWEISSNVIELDVTQMTLKTGFGITVQASERTDLQGPDKHKHIGFPFLSVGDRLEIEGQWQKDGLFIAEEIEVDRSKRLDPQLDYKNEHEVTGRIESLDTESLSVEILGVRVFFSDKTRNKSLLLY